MVQHSLAPVGVAFSLVGSALLILGLVLAVQRSRRRRDWTRTRGTVVGWRHSGGGSDGVSIPKVGFTTAEGQEVTASLGFGVDLGIYPTGQEVDVWYDPLAPHRAQANVMGTGCAPYAFILVGVALVGFGVTLVVL